MQKNMETNGTEKNSKAMNINNLIIAIEALPSNAKEQKDSLFADIYTVVAQAVARKVPQKSILEQLAAAGLKLHPIRFRQMMEKECLRRMECGETVVCKVCGQVAVSQTGSTTMTDALAQDGISGDHKVES